MTERMPAPHMGYFMFFLPKKEIDVTWTAVMMPQTMRAAWTRYPMMALRLGTPKEQ
jgi:hypothetical protein